jgi:hypothetical protein
MARKRLGKQERALRKDQWSILRTVRSEVVKSNLSSPKPERVRFASLRDLGAYAARAKVSQLVIKQDSGVRNKRLVAQYGLPDQEYYTEKLDVTGGAKEECMVRVGTTKPSLLILQDKIDPDTGKPTVMRLTAKPKYMPVGMPGTFPKDGGK